MHGSCIYKIAMSANECHWRTCNLYGKEPRRISQGSTVFVSDGIGNVNTMAYVEALVKWMIGKCLIDKDLRRVASVQAWAFLVNAQVPIV